MKPGFNPTGWIDDLRECVCCGVDAEHLHQTGKPPLKPIPEGLQGPKGLHCASCIAAWTDVYVNEIWPDTADFRATPWRYED
jgi:hypothetical protein